MIISYSFSSLNPGKNILIIGAVHGNEHCGPLATYHMMEEIRLGNIQIIQGSVTFIPICNPEGYKQKKRFIEENLARIFDKYENPVSYEQKCSTTIAPYVDRCDALMDIHSGNAKNSNFVFQDHESEEYKNITSKLGFDLIVHNRPGMYPNDEAKDPSSYANDQGKPGIVIECGQHDDPQAQEVAYNAIKHFMAYYGIINHPHKLDKSIHHVWMEKLVYMDRNGILVQDWKNGDPIKKGDHIATYEDDGEKVLSDIDGYIILPKQFATPGIERFYLATKM